LLGQHDGEADTSNDPGHGGVHLVRSGKFEGGGAEGIGEQLSEQRRVDRDARLDQATAGLLHALDEVRREEGRREGQEIERNEEDFVEEAEDEEYGLKRIGSAITQHLDGGGEIGDRGMRTLLV
jgi:hypothetical protein